MGLAGERPDCAGLQAGNGIGSMRDFADDEEVFAIVVRMSVLYRLQEREYGAMDIAEDQSIFSKIRLLALRERGLDERSRFENDLNATCRLFLEDQSGFVEMLVNRTLAGRGVITSSDVCEARRISNSRGGPA